jgi:uncharacterized protein with von Willebrand factor type A (vWA) domain
VKRILFDVGRWSIYLHRESRGLAAVDECDAAEIRFEDELFERLFAGDVEPLPQSDHDPVMAPWAERVHAVCTQLPAFERLGSGCRGDPDAAGVAVEVLIGELRSSTTEVELRRAARSACAKAAVAVEQLHEVVEGLEHVAYHNGAPGASSSNVTDGRATSRLAARLRDDGRLRRIAELAGRFKRIAAMKRRTKVRHGADDVGDVEQGSDPGRLLPYELARLIHPRLRLSVLRDMLEDRCLQYQLTGTAAMGKGPLVVLLDKSSSMAGERDVWATAVALALLEVARRERRTFALLGFDGSVKSEHIVQPGERLPLEALHVPCAGGTCIDAAIDRGLELIAAQRGDLLRADIVLITDGESETNRVEDLRRQREAMGASVFGVGIGIASAALDPWCDESVSVQDLETMSDGTAALLFET